jgi:leucyl aminopeptidase
MKITFRDAADASLPRLQAVLVDQDALPAGLEPAIVQGAAAARFTGKAGQVFEGFVERGGKLVRLALAGVGKPGDSGRAGAFERAGAALTARFLRSGENALALDLSQVELSAADAAAVLLGLRLRGWRHDLYRTRLKDDQKATLEEAIVTGAPAGTEAAWATEAALADGVEFTRELVAEPANIIYPESFVARCKERYRGTGLELTILDEKEMEKLGMGALLGVAQGSVRKPRLLAIVWNGGAKGAKPTAFVGKGVTFDTGGISIKPAAGMEDMKWDMGGAGAVAGTMLALARRKAKANVIGVCGLVENMPDGNAQRPGDGRLVLCDVLTWLQQEHEPAQIVDLATLTGAMIISLGHEYAGIFSNNDKLADQLTAAGSTSGDRLWRMPLGDAYDKLIDSPIADIKNVGPRYGGSITAAQFIKRFVERDTPWAHLDIAGTVWADKPGATWEKGATGYGVRLLDRFVRDTLEG